MLYPNFKNYVRERGLVSEGDGVVLSVSGGVDSMAMMDLVLRLAGPMKLKVSVAHVNHGLRGAASQADEELVRHAAEEGKVPFALLRREPEKGENLQDSARRIRMDFLRKAAAERDARSVLLGHNRADQAETVLMHIVRGSGLEGLVGMRPLAEDDGVRIVRPILFAPREEILEYARERRIGYRQDETNLTLKYRRNEIRHRLMPLLAELNPRVEEAIASMADRLAGESEALSLLAEACFHEVLADVSDGRIVMRAEAYADFPKALRMRILKLAWQRASGAAADLNSDQLERMDGIAIGGKREGRYRLKSPFSFVRSHDRLEISSA